MLSSQKNAINCYGDKQLEIGVKLSVSLRFKGIILKSVFQKHRKKQIKSLQNAFYKWYIRRNDQKTIKDTIDRVFIAQNQPKFSPIRFFYRVKYFVRNQKETSRENQRQIAVPECNQQCQMNEQSHIMANPLHLKQKFDDDNLSEYFQSLKNILSLKLIERQNMSNDGIEQKERCKKPEFKYLLSKSKTQGCQLNNESEAQSSNRKVNFQYQQSEDKEKSYQQVKELRKIKFLGRKVSLTLIKSFMLNMIKRSCCQGFQNIRNFSSRRNLQLKNQEFTNIYISQLQRIANEDSENCSSQNFQPNQKFQSSKQPQADLLNSSQSICSQLSSVFSIPSPQSLNIRINHVEYSIQLLSQTIDKEQQIKSLYKEFEQQYKQFAAIANDFQQIKIKNKATIFEKINSVYNKSLLFTQRQVFQTLRNHYLKQNLAKKMTFYKNQSTKSIYEAEGFETLSKSRVNLQTLRQIFSKPLILPEQLFKEQITSQNQQKIASITSIKIANRIEDHRNVKSQYQFDKTPRTGIRKQNLKSKTLCVQNNFVKQMNSTVGNQQKNIERSHIRQKSNPNTLQANNHAVNFNFLNSSSEDISQMNQISQRSCQISIKQQDLFKKKSYQQKKQVKYQRSESNKICEDSSKDITDQDGKTSIYDVSIKTLQSVESSQTKKLHLQIKSQYWWKECTEQKQNIVNMADKSKDSYEKALKSQRVDSKTQFRSGTSVQPTNQMYQNELENNFY